MTGADFVVEVNGTAQNIHIEFVGIGEFFELRGRDRLYVFFNHKDQMGQINILFISTKFMIF